MDLCFLTKIDDWLLAMLDGSFFGSKGKVLWRCITPSFLWGLWKERKSRCSNIHFLLSSPFSIWGNTMPLGGTYYTKLFCNYNLLMIINNWKALLREFCGEELSLYPALGLFCSFF